MPNLGPVELIVILLIIVAVFGAGKLADIGGTLGKGVKEFRQATKEVEKAQEELSQTTATEPDVPKAGGADKQA